MGSLRVVQIVGAVLWVEGGLEGMRRDRGSRGHGITMAWCTARTTPGGTTRLVGPGGI